MLEIVDENIRASIETIFRTYLDSGYECYLVGGAPRDLMLGQIPHDFDFATNAPFEFTEQAFARVIDTGMRHGTLTVLFGKQTFEITRYRVDAVTDGRHAEVKYVKTIYEDLSRRDFTCNAMALTLDGEIIDPFNGADDLANGRVIFVGDTIDRIREDYLRILRWFRFSARYYRETFLDEETLNVVAANAVGLERISRERVWMEMAKIISGPIGPIMLMVMVERGIHKYMDLPEGNFNALMLAHQFTNDPVALMAAYCSEVEMIETLAAKWKWSVDERNKGKNICHNLIRESFTLADAKRQTVLGNDKAWGVLALLAKHNKASAALLEAWDVPVLPVAGADLVAVGMTPGPRVGMVHRMMRDRWIESDYTMTKNDLLKLIPAEDIANAA